jgi:hypothetical protein
MPEHEKTRLKVESVMTGFSVPIFASRNSFEPRPRPLVANEWLRGAPFVTVVDISDEGRLLDLKGQGFQTFSFEERPDKLVVCPQDFEVSETPLRAGHDGSMSTYKVDMRKGRNRFLVSYLGPNARTSEGHGHPPRLPGDADGMLQDEAAYLELDEMTKRYPKGMYEYYERLFGSFKIHHTPDDEGHWAPEFFRIDPGILHQMEGGPEGAIIFNTMFNANLYPEDLQHIHF